MNLLVIRHGIAEDRDVFARSGEDDDLRPLTDDGRRKMARGSQGLRVLVPKVDLLATSPLVRARQTAEIVAEAYGITVAEQTKALTPDASFTQFITWIVPHADKDVVAVVGHEPHLSTLVAWLLPGLGDSSLELKKGGACLVEFDGKPRRGAGVLRWLHTSATLRELAK